MSWHEALTWAEVTSQLRKKASFRDAKFFVSDTSTTFGRRNIIHQYPNRDKPFIEDMGLDTDEFTIEGYVVQNEENDQNYFAERDALITALREKGLGQLIHPFLGILTVSLVDRIEMTESFRQGGIARFTMSFVRAEEAIAPFPVEVIDHVGEIDDVVEGSLFDGVDGIGAIYDGDDVPDFSSSSVQTAIDSLNDMLKSVTVAIQAVGPAQVSRALAFLSKEYLGINLATISSACSLANGIVGMFNGLLSIAGMYGDIIISQLFGPCSSFVRGISSGPWSGAQVEIPETGGFAGSTMSDPAIISEDFGRSIVRSALALVRYGEATGNDNPSQYGGTLDSITINTVS
ncbi:hypothetical protein LCGC14_2187620, partial [marine sediment metagenome]